MSNSHPLCPLFMTSEPVAHPLLPVVVAMVPFSSQRFWKQYISIMVFMFTRTYCVSQHRPQLLAVAEDSCKNKNDRIGWMLTMRSAWWRIYGRSKVMENLWGKGTLQCRKLRYNKVGRHEAIPQCEATKKTGSKVKAKCNLWSFICICWLATFVSTCTAMSLLLLSLWET